MYGINKLYGASIYYPQTAGEIKFQFSELEIEQVTANSIITKHSYFVRPNFSTRFFDLDMLNKENEITKNLTTFYSENKESCIIWLNEKREDYIDDMEFELKRLKKSKIVERTNDD
jgi:uncharacterized protein YqgQ